MRSKKPSKSRRKKQDELTEIYSEAITDFNKYFKARNGKKKPKKDKDSEETQKKADAEE